ncbi:MAG: hypothetical protein WDN69_04565 [Aliidongia sp.]
MLRTKNDKAHHLGLPLPAGRMAAYQKVGERTLLFGRTELADKAEDEEVELQFGDAPDLQVIQASLPVKTDPRSGRGGHDNLVEIDSERRETTQFELEILLKAGEKIVDADHTMTMKNGQPLFALSIPAGDKVSVHFRTEGP